MQATLSTDNKSVVFTSTGYGASQFVSVTSSNTTACPRRTPSGVSTSTNYGRNATVTVNGTRGAVRRAERERGDGEPGSELHAELQRQYDGRVQDLRRHRRRGDFQPGRPGEHREHRLDRHREHQHGQHRQVRVTTARSTRWRIWVRARRRRSTTATRRWRRTSSTRRSRTCRTCAAGWARSSRTCWARRSTR